MGRLVRCEVAFNNFRKSRIGRHILRKFTHLKNASVIRVLEGNAQHFIGLERLIQGDEADLLVEKIIGGLKFAGECFLKVLHGKQAKVNQLIYDKRRIPADGIAYDL
jgi:hypothetical protein